MVVLFLMVFVIATAGVRLIASRVDPLWTDARAAAGTTPPPDTLPDFTERITAYDVHITIEPRGSILVRETIDYDFGVLYRHGIFRDVPVRVDYPPKAHHDRVYPFDVVSVDTDAGTPAKYVLEDVDGQRRIRIGDPDRTITRAHRYVIEYRVERVLNGFARHDELVWNAVGAQWYVPIEGVTVTVEAPADVRDVACNSGPVGSTLGCSESVAFGSAAVFRDDGLAAREALTVTVAIPKGAVPEPQPLLDERWHWGRPFALTAANVGGGAAVLALMVLVLGFKGMQIEEHAREVMAYCGQLTRDFGRFREDFELVGTHLGRAQSKYVEAEKRMGKFETKLERAAESDVPALVEPPPELPRALDAA